MDRRIIDVQNLCQILSNRMSRNGYLTNSVVDNGSIDSELSTLADLFNGRILIVNSGFRIVKDTFSLSEGKICISEEIIRCFQGEIPTGMIPGVTILSLPYRFPSMFRQQTG